MIASKSIKIIRKDQRHVVGSLYHHPYAFARIFLMSDRRETWSLDWKTSSGPRIHAACDARMVGKPLAAAEHDSDRCVIMNYSNRFSLLEQLLTNPWQFNSLSGCGEFQSVKKKKKSIGPVAKLLNFFWRKWRKLWLFFFSHFHNHQTPFLGGLHQQSTVVLTGIVFIILVSFCTLLVIGCKLLLLLLCASACGPKCNSASNRTQH